MTDPTADPYEQRNQPDQAPASGSPGFGQSAPPPGSADPYAQPATPYQSGYPSPGYEAPGEASPGYPAHGDASPGYQAPGEATTSYAPGYAAPGSPPTYPQPAYVVPYGAAYPAYHPITGQPYSDKSKIVAGILQLLLGGFGAGRFYTGHIGMAIAQIVVTVFTCGIGSIWGLIDGIIILVKGGTDAQGRLLRDS